MPLLTNLSISKLKPKPERFEIPDSGCKNLVLIIQPSGIKSWALRFRFKRNGAGKGEAIKYTIGRYTPLTKGASADPRVGDDLSIHDAHLLAQKILHDARRGIDPRKQAKQEEEGTFGFVARKYFTDVCGMVEAADGKVTFNRAMKKSGKDLWRTWTRQVEPVFGHLSLAAIDKATVREFVETLAAGELRNNDGKLARGGPISANRALAFVRMLVRWRERQSDDYRAPSFLGLAKHENVRERILSDDEIRLIWKAAGDLGAFGSLVKFLLVSCARRSEASGMTHDEVTEAKVQWTHGKAEISQVVWMLPGARSKTNKPLIRPLSKLAVQILDEAPKFESCKLFFSADGVHPVSAFSRWKKQLDQRVLEELRKQDPKAQPLQPWTLHDLRRTGRSLLSKTGVRPDISEMCLGHLVGNSIQQTYDVYDFAAEKLDAFERLARLIQVITTGGANVVQFPAAAGGSD